MNELWQKWMELRIGRSILPLLDPPAPPPPLPPPPPERWKVSGGGGDGYEAEAVDTCVEQPGGAAAGAVMTHLAAGHPLGAAGIKGRRGRPRYPQCWTRSGAGK